MRRGCSHVGVEGGTFSNGHCVGESSTPTHCFLVFLFTALFLPPSLSFGDVME